MSSIFDRFGGGGNDPAGAGNDPPPATSERERTTQPAGLLDAPEPETASAKPAAAPEILPGVPLWIHGVDGDALSIYWLSSLDPHATHEQGQNARHAGFDGDKQVPNMGDPVAASGGAAYYYSPISGKGFSLPIAPEGT